MWSNLQEAVDLVTFAEEIFNRKLHFLCVMTHYLPEAVLFLKTARKVYIYYPFNSIKYFLHENHFDMK